MKASIVGTTLDYAVIGLYFLMIFLVGSFFARKTKDTKDFFFAGQRFSWWMISFSMVATVVGSYSFIKYAAVGYKYGFSATQTYFNDWIWYPFLCFVWIPIIFFAKIKTIPEYFLRRFNKTVRIVVIFFLLTYLVGYVGINFYTLGTAIHALIGWDVLTCAIVVSLFSAVYVTSGGQNAVIMTDLMQGFILLFAGLLLLFLGLDYLGGWGNFVALLPEGFGRALPEFNKPPNFNFFGIFWQDAIANSAAFYLLNQGAIMRFLSAKNEREARKAVGFNLLILMPFAAIAVAGGGWIGRAMFENGDPALLGLIGQQLGSDPTETQISKNIFVYVSNILCVPGVFGFIMAALTAALMSTVDTLINAISSIFVLDIYKPYIKPGKDDKHYLNVARASCILAAIIGLALVPVFQIYKDIYSAHGVFTAAITPPLVVCLLFAILNPKFSPRSALAVLIGGGFLIFLSVLFPALLEPFSFGVKIFEGKAAAGFIRAFYGIAVCTVIGLICSFLDSNNEASGNGLSYKSIPDLRKSFKKD